MLAKLLGRASAGMGIAMGIEIWMGIWAFYRLYPAGMKAAGRDGSFLHCCQKRAVVRSASSATTPTAV